MEFLLFISRPKLGIVAVAGVGCTDYLTGKLEDTPVTLRGRLVLRNLDQCDGSIALERLQFTILIMHGKTAKKKNSLPSCCIYGLIDSVHPPLTKVSMELRTDHRIENVWTFFSS